MNLRQYGIFPPRFNGEGDYETWWSDLHAYFAAYPGMLDEQKIQILGSCITGSTRMILDSAGPLTTMAAADFTLRKVFAVPLNWTAKLWQSEVTAQSAQRSIRLILITLFLIQFF